MDFKRVFVAFNYFIALVGVTIVLVGVSGISIGSHAYNLGQLKLPVSVSVFGVLMTILGSLGVYGVNSSSEPVLKSYSLLSFLLLPFILIISINLMVSRSDVNSWLSDAWSSADEKTISKIEKAYQCCGYASVHDRPYPENCVEDRSYGFVIPCFKIIRKPYETLLTYLGAFGVFLAFIMSFCLVSALMSIGNAQPSYIHDASRLEESRHLLRTGELPTR